MWINDDETSQVTMNRFRVVVVVAHVIRSNRVVWLEITVQNYNIIL